MNTRETEFHPQIERHERQIQRLRRAILAESALAWLISYGPKTPQSTKENIGAAVSMNYASGCKGAEEARYFLEEAIGEMWPEIERRAETKARVAIEEATS